MKAKPIDLKTLLKKIRAAKTILLATHENPDGDGIGSILALGEGLKQLGKTVTHYIKDPVPKMYHFLPGYKSIKQELPKNKKYDLSFIVDLGELERVGKVFIDYPGRGETISLDHHKQGNHNADFNFCLPKEASSGEVIYKILKALKIKFNNKIATGIYTAMVTDTGSFKYSNTNAHCFAVAADLMQYKIDVWQVAFHCFESSSRERMEYLKRALHSLTVHANGKVAWLHLTLNDLHETGAKADEAEGFINYARSIEGVEVSVAFKEIGSELYKISLRSKTYVDVAAIANVFGGGGHIRASGCKIKGAFADVQALVLAEILKRL